MSKRKEVELVRDQYDCTSSLDETEVEDTVLKYVGSSRQIKRGEGIILKTETKKTKTKFKLIQPFLEYYLLLTNRNTKRKIYDLKLLLQNT